jgi:hypothetical protein
MTFKATRAAKGAGLGIPTEVAKIGRFFPTLRKHNEAFQERKTR